MREKSRELLLSKRVLAGRRTYFIDVKQPADGERYLSISESKRVRGEPYERSRIIVLEEYISLFFDELRLVLESIGLLKPAKAYTVEAIRHTYPKAYAKWTAEEDARLKNAYRQCKEIRTLADTFQRQPGAISSRLTKLGLKQD